MTSTSPLWPQLASVFLFLPVTAAPAPGLMALRTIPGRYRWSLPRATQTLILSVALVFISTPPPAQSVAKAPGPLVAAALAGFLPDQPGKTEPASPPSILGWYPT